jgi:hypothetical protein
MAAKRKSDLLSSLLEQIDKLSPDEQQEFLEQANLRLTTKRELNLPDVATLWDDIFNLSAQIPDQELVKLPKDGARNYKHYLYGHPKEA